MKRTVGKWGGTSAVRLTRELKSIGIEDVNGAKVDVYTINNVILISNDCSKEETVNKIIGGEKVSFSIKG